MYQPRPSFVSFHAREQRWSCIVAHRRAGKTVACIVDLIHWATLDSRGDARYAYVAPYFNQAKQIAWDYLKRYGAAYIVKASETELQVELGNGSRIRLYGADNPDSLRGMYLDGVILDEYADMRPSVWGEIVRPMLADRKGWAVFIGTPKGHNAFYDIHQIAKANNDWFSLVLRASESGLLDATELADAKRSMTEDQFEQEFECSFEAAIHGAVYGKWMSEADKQGRIKTGIYDTALPVHTAWDLGYDDATAIWFWQITYGEIRLVDYFEASGEDVGYYCGILKQRGYNYGNHYAPHDAANKTMAAGGRSIVEQAHGLGVKMQVIPATSQQNAIEAARKTIEASWFDPEKCKEGLEALKQYQFEYDEDKKTFKSKPRHDWASHGSDAFEIIGQVWQEMKPAPKPKPMELRPPTWNELIKQHERSKSKYN